MTLIHVVTMLEVLMAGELKKRDGVMRKKWIDVYVELRENSLTCFHSKEDRQILDTVMGELMVYITTDAALMMSCSRWCRGLGRG